jgi:hypothetical protein
MKTRYLVFGLAAISIAVSQDAVLICEGLINQDPVVEQLPTPRIKS